VLACSALKHASQDYRQGEAPGDVRYVHLRGSEEQLRQRLAERTGQFMNPSLVYSQFETLEPTEHALQVDITPAGGHRR
jgi:gluconokinase